MQTEMTLKLLANLLASSRRLSIFLRVEIFRFLFLITDATAMFASSRRTFRWARYTPPSTTCDRRLDCVWCVRRQCACEQKTRGKNAANEWEASMRTAKRGWCFFKKTLAYFIRRQTFAEWRSMSVEPILCGVRAMKNLSTHSFTSSSFRYHSYKSINQLLFTNNLVNALECCSSSPSHMRMTIFLTFCRLLAANPLDFWI